MKVIVLWEEDKANRLVDGKGMDDDWTLDYILFIEDSRSDTITLRHYLLDSTVAYLLKILFFAKLADIHMHFHQALY